MEIMPVKLNRYRNRSKSPTEMESRRNINPGLPGRACLRRPLFSSLFACLFLVLSAPSPAAEPAKHLFFAYCMDTADAQKRDLAAQATMLKEVGFDGGGHCWPFETMEERLRTLDSVGLKTVHIYATAMLPVDAPIVPEAGLRKVIPLLKDHHVQIALGIRQIRKWKKSDPAGDAEAVNLVRQIADLAQPVGATVVLYPHFDFWMEKLEDTVRLARQVDRPNVGVMFNLCHWLRAEGERDMENALRDALPLLQAVSINGCDTIAELSAANWETGRWIQPLGKGSYPVGDVLKMLDGLGYRGPVGLQCFGIGGDARVHLSASMTAWQQFYPKR